METVSPPVSPIRLKSASQTSYVSDEENRGIDEALKRRQRAAQTAFLLEMIAKKVDRVPQFRQNFVDVIVIVVRTRRFARRRVQLVLSITISLLLLTKTRSNNDKNPKHSLRFSLFLSLSIRFSASFLTSLIDSSLQPLAASFSPSAHIFLSANQIHARIPGTARPESAASRPALNHTAADFESTPPRSDSRPFRRAGTKTLTSLTSLTSLTGREGLAAGKGSEDSAATRGNRRNGFVS